MIGFVELEISQGKFSKIRRVIKDDKGNITKIIFEEERLDPEIGDILVHEAQFSESNKIWDLKHIFIYGGTIQKKCTNIYSLFCHRITENPEAVAKGKQNWKVPIGECRYANEEEEKLLFEEMSKLEYLFNYKTKKLEKRLPKAKPGGEYYTITINGVVRQKDCNNTKDSARYAIGNYFLEKTEAKVYLEKILNVFKERVKI